jgi:hypothetical protein
MVGTAVEDMKMMMVSTYNITRGERLYKNFDLEKAEDNRDALAKVGPTVKVHASGAAGSPAALTAQCCVFFLFFFLFFAGALWPTVCVDCSQSK